MGDNYFFESIQNPTSTREENFSEELHIIKNICFGQTFQIKAPFPTLHNTGYVLRYKLSIAAEENTNINIYLKISSYTSNQLLCTYTMEKKADWFEMTIYSSLTQTNKITMNFCCEKTQTRTSFLVNTEGEEYHFVIEEETLSKKVSISFYHVIIEDTTNSYLTSDYTSQIIRTMNGMQKCDNIDPEKQCLIGYNCESEDCKSCDFSCNECDNANNNEHCSGCTPLTNAQDSIGQQRCPINNIDFTNFEDFELEATISDGEFHERSTMGAWFYITDLSKARKGNSNIYHIVFKDRYILSIVPNEISVDVYCHAYEDLYRKITTETTLESNYKNKEGDYVLSQRIPTSNQRKYIDGTDLSGHWFYASCALSFDHKKFYVNTMINGELGTWERELRHENLYYDSEDSTYIENDIYNRHIMRPGDKLKVQFKNLGNAGSKVFLKYFSLFQVYIPPSYKFME